MDKRKIGDRPLKIQSVGQTPLIETATQKIGNLPKAFQPTALPVPNVEEGGPISGNARRV
jgi:hypothetical protein